MNVPFYSPLFSQVQKLISLSMWVCLPEKRRELELRGVPKWKKFYKAICKKIDKLPERERERADFDRRDGRGL